MIRHAGLLALRLDGVWRGLLVEGPSGVGKSDLALRAIEAGLSLVADDRVVVFASGDRLFGRAPDPLAGLIEARGVGVVAEPTVPLCEIVGLAHCVVTENQVERVPEPRFETILGHLIPIFDLLPREPSAPLKLRRLLQHLGASR
jgi:serine kinase of HPr protein (carbohydrate metabolism regulator)